MSGWVRAYLGEAERAVDHLFRAMRLSPVDSEINRMQTGVATVHLLSGRFDEAFAWAQRAPRERSTYPTALRLAAASSALAGRPEEAGEILERLRQVDPTLRLSNLRARMPFRRAEHLALYAEGLR